jgi:hypothetical protein
MILLRRSARLQTKTAPRKTRKAIESKPRARPASGQALLCFFAGRDKSCKDKRPHRRLKADDVSLNRMLDDEPLTGRQFHNYMSALRHKAIFREALPVENMPSVVIKHDHPAGNNSIE